MKQLQEPKRIIQDKIDYYFNNEDLLYQAFTRKSYSAEYGGEDNEVLEFHGDAVLKFCVTKLIYDKYGKIKDESDRHFNPLNFAREYFIKNKINEADFSQFQNQILSNEYLAKRIDELNFYQYVSLGRNDSLKDASKKKKADLFEAIVAAITLDSNWNLPKIVHSIKIMLNINDNLDFIEQNRQIITNNSSFTFSYNFDKAKDFVFDNSFQKLKNFCSQNKLRPPFIEIDPKPEQSSLTWWKGHIYIELASEKIQFSAKAGNKKDLTNFLAYLVLCKLTNTTPKYNKSKCILP
ncbi:ribonuclease III domain-containing protein [Mycoplasma simbae]|uniref:ribonuclease III domain-containing protein n=1 Tax=Mycoplasma simbae TaxID=36744 RepID=UPI00068B2FB6|nr:ribonuclease III domain-containing protein [Mycoplasma simbae]